MGVFYCFLLGQMVVGVADLLKWFSDAGGKVHPNLEVIKGPKGHLLFVVTKEIKEGEKLLEMPDEIILSLDNSDFVEIDFTGLHDEILSDMTPYRIQGLIALFEHLKPHCNIQYEPAPIVRKKKKKKRQRQAVVQPTGPVQGKESTWSTYLQYLSERQNVSSPAFWDEDSCKQLEGTSLEDRIEDLDQHMHAEFEKLILPFFGEQALKLGDPKLLTFDLFKKFFSFSTSYCWADETAEIFLAPLAELFSYTTTEEAANVEIEYGETSVNVVAKENLAAKSKLYNFAGEIGTAEYVWKWGVIDHNPTEECPKGSAYDTVQIEPELVFETCLKEGNMEDDPVSEEKLELLQDIGMLIDIFEIEKDGEIPNDLLLAVKVLFMDAEEFAIYKAEMIQSGYILDEEEDSEGEEAPEDNKPNPEPSTSKETKNESPEPSEDDAEVNEEEMEGEDEADMQILPEITNEAAVFKALITIAETKQSLIKTDNVVSGIAWDKAGILRKPALIAAYLKELDKDILNRFITECNKQAKNINKKEDKKQPKAGKKRKLSTNSKVSSGSPNAKKQKPN